ncbi:hypothetical protein [Rugamonas aquatica]|uniref:Macro domain-containing protein n=1 Tax=Rugamonas aquatica TaxID=2743357 RepID=A0A6A7N6Q5_9BURK|nr:hypothetical protein [Rugamonas aquatica]MQA40716.1 hypothetical protein [Rugamonas aquatica]
MFNFFTNISRFFRHSPNSTSSINGHNDSLKGRAGAGSGAFFSRLKAFFNKKNAFPSSTATLLDKTVSSTAPATAGAITPSTPTSAMMVAMPKTNSAQPATPFVPQDKPLTVAAAVAKHVDTLPSPILGNSPPPEWLTAPVPSPTAPASATAAAADTYSSQRASDFSTEEINDWLFNHSHHPKLPKSQLHAREQEKYAPKTSAYFSTVAMQPSDDPEFSGRMGVYEGGITDLQANPDEKAAVACSNNGDLLLGCGFAVAKAVVNAAGPGLQAQLYNTYGVPGVMQQPQYALDNKDYAKTENRGYAITCDSHDMATTHHVKAIELLTVPMHNPAGLENMYREALIHSKDMDYIALPMAGMSHPLLNGPQGKEISAAIATKVAKEFIRRHPTSKLKIIFVIYNDKQAVEAYKKQIATSRADHPTVPAVTAKSDSPIGNVSHPRMRAGVKQYTLDDVRGVLFEGKKLDKLPPSTLGPRNKEQRAPKTNFSQTEKMTGPGCNNRLHLYAGAITDLRAGPDETAAIACTHYGDLDLSSGFPLATSVVNATGAGLQMELYNNYGVPKTGGVVEFDDNPYSATEGRGYAITCGAHDMVTSHGVNRIEVLSPPVNQPKGFFNMYMETLEHSKDLDYIALPMVGLNLPSLNGNKIHCVEIAVHAAKSFIRKYPASKLKIVFTVFNDPKAMELYRHYSSGNGMVTFDYVVQ